MRRIDAHQHFWKLDRGDYGWLTPELEPIYRDFMPEDLTSLLERNGVDGTVLVQAAPTIAETDFMLSLADRHAFIEGVVGWADFESEDAAGRIAELARRPKLKGLRPMIQDIDDVDWMLRPTLDAAYSAVIANDLVFDALVLPRHLDNLTTLLARYPAMRVVVDHCAKPDIAAGEFSEWSRKMTAIATRSEACCKLSGLVTEAGESWDVEKLRPYVEHVLEVFGTERVIWGSDWPVCTLKAAHGDWIETTDRLLQGCTPEERAAILGGNAVRVYRLGAA